MNGYANPQLLTTPRELADARRRRDAASRRWCSTCGRRRPSRPATFPARSTSISGALSLIDTDPAPLKAFMWMIEHLLDLRGVTPTTPVVVYDEQSGMRAARAFWFLEYFGHPSVRVLDGGFGAWVAAGTAGDARRAAAAQERVDRRAATSARSRPGATCSAPRHAGRRDPRHAQRRRVLRHDRAREARRRGPGRRAHRVDPQPRPRRRVQAGRRAAGDVRRCRRHARPRSDHVLPGRLPRRALRISRCGCSATRGSATTSAPGRNGATARTCPIEMPIERRAASCKCNE